MEPTDADYLFPDPFAFAKSQIDDSTDIPGSRCEIKTYEARYNSKDIQVILQVGTDRHLDSARDKNHDSALVLTKFYDKEQELDYTELEIRSPHLRTALREVIPEYPGINLDAPIVVLQDLPMCFFHYREELQAYGLTLEDPTAVQHLVFALQYMFQILKSQMTSYYYYMETPNVAPGLEFLNLWMAYRPGSLVYTKFENIDKVFRLKSMTRCTCQIAHCWNSRWTLSVEYIDFDGEDFGYRDTVFFIRPYQNYERLEVLKVFPLEYHPNKDFITSKLVARGRKFVALRGVHHRSYEGTTYSLSPFRRTSLFAGEEDDFPLQSITIKSRIVVDSKTFGRARPAHQVYLSVRRIIRTETEDHLKLTENDIILCHHRMPGFALSNKRWCLFEVDSIQEIEYNSDAFGTLILPSDLKETIQSLVEVHSDKRLGFDDVIKGKGKGTIFLLHGPPGTGKTLTAESVADYTKRPLYFVSSGDLGIEVEKVEANLMAIIELATAWNAIILIDEADIFLEQRSLNDIQRNGLVSIFLRVLEYYEGILFLTTNRIGAFDTAFKSRIHFAIKYPDLSVASRRDLWKSFITRGARDVTLGWMDAKCLDTLAAEELNGRQIKNTVRTAHALAVSAGTELNVKHIRTALKAMKAFDIDLAEEGEEEQNRVAESEYRSKRPRQA